MNMPYDVVCKENYYDMQKSLNEMEDKIEVVGFSEIFNAISSKNPDKRVEKTCAWYRTK